MAQEQGLAVISSRYELTPMEAHAAYLEEKRDIIRRICMPEAHQKNDALFETFLEIGKLTMLNPIRKQLYCIDYGQGPTIVTGIDGLRVIASRTREYAGGDPYEHVDGAKAESGVMLPVSATCTVYRMVGGVRCPFTCTVLWEEFGKKPFAARYANNWKTMPYHMLGKVAESHALRRAFPEDMSGLYTTDEMSQAEVETVQAREIRQPGKSMAPPARIAPLSAPRTKATAQPNGQEEQRRKLVEAAQARGVGLTEDMDASDMATVLDTALSASGFGHRVVRTPEGAVTARALSNAILAFPPRTVDQETGEVQEQPIEGEAREEDPYEDLAKMTDADIAAGKQRAFAVEG